MIDQACNITMHTFPYTCEAAAISLLKKFNLTSSVHKGEEYIAEAILQNQSAFMVEGANYKCKSCTFMHVCIPLPTANFILTIGHVLHKVKDEFLLTHFPVKLVHNIYLPAGSHFA